MITKVFFRIQHMKHTLIVNPSKTSKIKLEDLIAILNFILCLPDVINILYRI